jgi:hypothetical protein
MRWPRARRDDGRLLGLPLGAAKPPSLAAFTWSGPTGGSANTKGAWFELFAAVPFEVCGMWITQRQNTGVKDFLTDIGVGQAGGEQVLIENLHLCQPTTGFQHAATYWPVRVPAGERLSARVQSTAGAVGLNTNVVLVARGFRTPPAGHTTETWGANTSDSGGTAVDAGGGGLSSKGSWVQLVAATERPVTYINVSVGARSNGSLQSGEFVFDIGVGPSGLEEVLIPDIAMSTEATTDGLQPGAAGPFPVYVPAGTRVSARSASNVTDSNDRILDVIAYGVNL